MSKACNEGILKILQSFKTYILCFCFNFFLKDIYTYIGRTQEILLTSIFECYRMQKCTAMMALHISKNDIYISMFRTLTTSKRISNKSVLQIFISIFKDKLLFILYCFILYVALSETWIKINILTYSKLTYIQLNWSLVNKY